jgi:hypothetical protein
MALDNTYDKPSQVRENFSLSVDLFNLAFGYVKPPFPQISLIPEINPLGFVKALRGSFHFRNEIGNEYTMPVKLDDYEIPCEPSIGMFGSKNVVETKLNRIDPATKKQAVQNIVEETSLNNYQIRIRGVIYNEADYYDFPEDDVVRLRTIYETPGARTIENSLLNMFGINKITILRLEWPELPGYPGAQPFEIVAISDETDLYPLELV